jgi:DNA (cytosine-5)-methyltransferase 1
MTLVLSLFPGIGLLDKAFEEEGFCVVRGPDVLWGGDVRKFHPPAGKFAGVIGGPPCQAFSRLAHMVRQNGLQPKFGNLIPEFERVVHEASPAWFVMENVPDAPTPSVVGYSTWSCVLNNRQCFDDDGQPAKQNRVRRWTFGDSRCVRALMIDVAVFENQIFEYAATGGSQRGSNGHIVAQNRGGKPKRSRMLFNSKSKHAVAELLDKQGLPADFMQHSPFTVEAQCKALGNGVPLPMGRAIARAVKEATR